MGNTGYLILGVAIGVAGLWGYHTYVRPLPAPDCGCGGGHEEPAPESDVAISGEGDDAELGEILAGRGGGE